MKFSAIICEYNPLHNGHIRLIDFAKKQSQFVVCIMSGNFTQRAMPAIADKYTRARHAILSGADIVIELPTISAISSAQDFADGAMGIIKQLPIDTLVFGSELGDTTLLQQCADAIMSNSQNEKIQQLLKGGISYPKAMAEAYSEFSQILSTPNNMLAIEYLQAMKRNNCNVTPLTLMREDNYNNAELASNYASATAIRNNLTSENVKKYLPQYVLEDCDNAIEESYKRYACNYLSTLSSQQLSDVYLMTEGLHNRIYNSLPIDNFDNMITAIKSKRYTQLKINRLVLSSVLGITQEVATNYKASKTPIRVLAVKESSAREILTSFSNALLILCDNDSMDIDKRANRLYSALSEKTMPFSMQKVNI